MFGFSPSRFLSTNFAESYYSAFKKHNFIADGNEVSETVCFRVLGLCNYITLV